MRWLRHPVLEILASSEIRRRESECRIGEESTQDSRGRNTDGRGMPFQRCNDSADVVHELLDSKRILTELLERELADESTPSSAPNQREEGMSEDRNLEGRPCARSLSAEFSSSGA